MRDGYILMEWGGSSTAMHSQAFPDASPPAVCLVHLPFTRVLLEHADTAAYLPVRQIEPLIKQAVLLQVDGAPEFAVYRRNNECMPVLDQILSTVSRSASADEQLRIDIGRLKARAAYRRRLIETMREQRFLQDALDDSYCE